MANATQKQGVLVIGLGRFGSALADTLDLMDVEVLAVERDPDLVERWAARLPVVEADATDARALDQVSPPPA